MTEIRSFPADTKRQHFFTEQYEKEDRTRLDWYNKKQRGQARGVSGGASRVIGLPTINPTQFAVEKKREEDETMRKIREEARAQYKSFEMYPAEKKDVKQLFDGFTKEERGRYRYLKARNLEVPEKKYTFPILSSWQYGWKLEEHSPSKRPNNARTCLIRDTFYTRNGMPTLPISSMQPAMDRGYTTHF